MGEYTIGLCLTDLWRFRSPPFVGPQSFVFSLSERSRWGGMSFLSGNMIGLTARTWRGGRQPFFIASEQGVISVGADLGSLCAEPALDVAVWALYSLCHGRGRQLPGLQVSPSVGLGVSV